MQGKSLQSMVFLSFVLFILDFDWLPSIETSAIVDKVSALGYISL
jgi:hypothetical protein